jgi:hypothetical protein
MMTSILISILSVFALAIDDAASALQNNRHRAVRRQTPEAIALIALSWVG